MKARAIQSVCSLILVSLLILSARGQITFDEIGSLADGDAGDHVLNAPYRGTINSLREDTMRIGYGENRTLVHPINSSGTMNLIVPNDTISVWHTQSPGLTAWDRSVLRLYVAVDASGREIDLTNATSEATGVSLAGDLGADNVLRLSLRAIATKSLAPVQFALKLKYRLQSSPPGSYQMPSETIRVAPATNSFVGVVDESEAFLFGVPLLDVRCGNARLVVPTGRTAFTVAAAMATRAINSSLQVPRYDVILPWAAESVYIQDRSQFTLSTTGLFRKANYGTPWPGHLLGFFAERQGGTVVSIRFRDGTLLDSDPNDFDESYRYVWRLSKLRPFELIGSPAAQTYTWDTNFSPAVVTTIRDNQTPNSITLNRDPAGYVTSVQTSDGRSWTILTHADGGHRITGIVPGDGFGARYFKYLDSLDTVNKYRVNQVRLGAGNGGNDTDPNTGDQIMYKFVFRTSGDIDDIQEEWRYVDGQLRKVVEHNLASAAERQRRELSGTDPNGIRRFDFTYDTSASPALNHRLKRFTSYSGADGTGQAHVTEFVNKIGLPSDSPSSAGTMVLLTESLPDGTTLTHEYDARVDGAPINVGLRTKTTHTGPSGSLVTLDQTYEFLYSLSSVTYLFHWPRVVKVRDGRGAASEVTYAYEAGGADQASPDGTPADGLQGQLSNQLRTVTGPTINSDPNNARTPQRRYSYYASAGNRSLKTVETTSTGAGAFRTVDYEYDSLLRPKKVIDDKAGLNVATEYGYNDTPPTQDRWIIDPNGFYRTTTFDYGGRARVVKQYLDPGGTAGAFYQTEFLYDNYGRLQFTRVDNKGQVGEAISPNPIVTRTDTDLLGRVTMRVMDPGGIGATESFTYNWLGQTLTSQDTSARGTRFVYGDGRGLLTSEVPLDNAGMAVASLAIGYQYDANGRLEFVNSPTGAVDQTVYDNFGRVSQRVLKPGPSGGGNIATVFEYDAANNVTRASVRDGFTIGDPASGIVRSDSTWKFDQGGFCFESRQRTIIGVDDGNDPVTTRRFDWSGKMTDERSLGDGTVATRVMTYAYDGAKRVGSVDDSEGGQSTYTRDKRGNVTDLTVKLDASTTAVTTTIYDALSRPIRVTDPNDQYGQRHYRERRYDSRGNLLRETRFTSGNAARTTSINVFDAAGRRAQSAMLAIASGFTDPITAVSKAVDRVTDYEYDADARLRFVHLYNNSTATPRTTATTYDTVGRRDVVTDPSGSFTDDSYDPNGRLASRIVYDGRGSRTFTFGYDGHDRRNSLTALGTPDLMTQYEYDACDRMTRLTGPKGIKTRTDFDLVGRQKSVVENETGGALERQTDLAYNRLSQLITQTAKNKTAAGAPLADQVSRYRYDTMDRLLRTFYPDTTDSNFEVVGCTDCIRNVYDKAGRRTDRYDQRGWRTQYGYDKRSLLLTRTTTNDDRKDTFDYDAMGRLILAQRGTSAVADLFAKSTPAYTDLSDLNYELQTIAQGTARTVDYTNDQAGNRTGLTYPGGTTLTMTPTVINQPGTIIYGSQSVAYSYYNGGRALEKRDASTTVAGTSYRVGWGFDSHRRVSSVNNSVVVGGSSQPQAYFSFTHDNNGNQLTQTATGSTAFDTDDRTFTIDALDRVAGASYGDFPPGAEASTLDLRGNRQQFADRGGGVASYGSTNPANEYASIGGVSISYDAAGNVSVDENGRKYFYDEANRLVEVQNAGSAVLAQYTYDALGRRVTATIGGATTRYYHDGRREIEERSAADARLRYHINGAQYLDERVATFEDGSGQFRYYVLGDRFSVVGAGNASGSSITGLRFGALGDFVCQAACNNCEYGRTCPGDADGDGCVTQDDLDIVLFTYGTSLGQPGYSGCADFDCDGDVDQDDLDSVLFYLYSCCPWDCEPSQGQFALHGRPVDVLPDGKALLYVRARYYDPENGRWLQRDPAGYVDGANLYESFRSNANRFTDPTGKYGKLASGWGSGDDVRYQHFTWPLSRAPSDEFSVGRYFHVQGQKVICFDDRSEPFAYALSYEQVRAWSKGRTRFDRDGLGYLEFVRSHGERIDRVTGKVVERGIFENLADAIDEAAEENASRLNLAVLDPMVLLAGPAVTTLTGETMPSPWLGGSSRDVNRLEYLAAAGNTALMAAPPVAWIVRTEGGAALRGFPVTVSTGATEAMGEFRVFAHDLAHVSGKTAAARNRAIQAVLREDLRSLQLTYEPQYSPFVAFGMAQEGSGTHIGASSFASRAQLRNTIIHEELHHRWWSRGIYDHHPAGTLNEARFYETIRRYQRMRGWE